MALVRCTCIAETSLAAEDRRVEVVVPDPDCGVAAHRSAARPMPEALPG